MRRLALQKGEAARFKETLEDYYFKDHSSTQVAKLTLREPSFFQADFELKSERPVDAIAHYKTVSAGLEQRRSRRARDLRRRKISCHFRERAALRVNRYHPRRAASRSEPGEHHHDRWSTGILACFRGNEQAGLPALPFLTKAA
jgi:hypothetical protein